jgi:hypothetical protein
VRLSNLIWVTLVALLSREVGNGFLTCSGNLSQDIFPSLSIEQKDRDFLALAAQGLNPHPNQLAESTSEFLALCFSQSLTD